MHRGHHLTNYQNAKPSVNELPVDSPSRRASNEEHRFFLAISLKKLLKKTVNPSMIWYTIALMWHHCDVLITDVYTCPNRFYNLLQHAAYPTSSPHFKLLHGRSLCGIFYYGS